MTPENQQSKSFAGKNILVTGGHGGIGFAVVTAFAEAGANVISGDLVEAEPAGTQKTALFNLHQYVVDVTRSDQLDVFFSDIAARFRHIDVVVHTVGIAGPIGPLECASDSEIRMVFETNIISAILVSKRVKPLLEAAGGGSLFYISSVAEKLGYPKRAPYAATKAALSGLTRSLATEWGSKRVRVNCIAPGAVEGPPLRKAFARRARDLRITVEAAASAYEGQSSLGILISAAKIAELILFLSSPHGDSISGQTIFVDGNTTTLIY